MQCNNKDTPENNGIMKEVTMLNLSAGTHGGKEVELVWGKKK